MNVVRLRLSLRDGVRVIWSEAEDHPFSFPQAKPKPNHIQISPPSSVMANAALIIINPQTMSKQTRHQAIITYYTIKGVHDVA